MVWVVSHEKGAIYLRNADLELQSQGLTKTGRSTCWGGGGGGHLKVKSLPVGNLLYRMAMAVGPASVRKWHVRLRKIWLTFITLCGF